MPRTELLRNEVAYDQEEHYGKSDDRLHHMLRLMSGRGELYTTTLLLFPSKVKC